MDFTSISVWVSLLIALSVASERFVEITKGVIPWLNLQKADPVAEGWRKAAIQVLAVAGGIIVTALSAPAIQNVTAPAAVAGAVATTVKPMGVMSVIALGLLSSGGSGFWNSVLGYVQNLKELKATAVATAKELGNVKASARQPAGRV